MYFFVDVCGVHHDLLVLTHASPTRRSSYLSDALETGGGARGRLDLDDEVDGPHVDAELEAAGGDHAAERARLELLLDLGPLLLRHRAVVRLGEDRRGAGLGAGLGHDGGGDRGLGQVDAQKIGSAAGRERGWQYVKNQEGTGT